MEVSLRKSKLIHLIQAGINLPRPDYDILKKANLDKQENNRWQQWWARQRKELGWTV